MGKWVCENVLCSNIEICQWENLHTMECRYRKRYLTVMLGDKPPRETCFGKLLRKKMAEA